MRRRGFVRPAPWAGLGAPRAGGRGRVLELLESAPASSRPSTSTRSWSSRLRVELQLAPEFAGARQDQAGAQRGAHRRKRPTDAAPARATSGLRPVGGTSSMRHRQVYSGFFVAEEGTMVVPRARRGDHAESALIARGRRRCGQGQPDPGRPGLGAARHRVDRRRRPGAARSACSGPCRSACPRSCASPGSPPRGQSLSRGALLAAHNARFAHPAADTGSAFVAFAARSRTSSAPRSRVVAGGMFALQEPHAADPGRSPPPPLRQGAGPGARISRRPPGRLPRTQVSGALPRRRRNHRRRQARPRDPLRRDRARACGEVVSSAKQPT